MNNNDIRVKEVSLYYLPISTRIPLKFGPETLTSVTCARVKIKVQCADGREAEGWGETPLSVQWVWPLELPYDERYNCLTEFCELLVKAWSECEFTGHAFEIGYEFIKETLPELLEEINENRLVGHKMPYLAALVCCSAFDIALHDAYGNIHSKFIYSTYNKEYMNRDLSYYLTDANDSSTLFEGKYPCDFLVQSKSDKIPVWHLVGGKDIVEESEYTGTEPQDGYPVILDEWVKRDGLTCLKVKLKGNDVKWDYDRVVKVGRIAVEQGVLWLSADFNCTVKDPVYVNNILDRLLKENPRIFAMILYVEQPFPYEIEENQIDVRSVSARKPLFMDESAHDWRLVKLGRSLGWSGVALKTCKTQTGALLSLCWAKAHGMTLMVQDLSNPMLAQIPHVLLAAYAGTIMGVESNGMQFYPEVSAQEAKVHPGLYSRKSGMLDLTSITGSGFGYRIEEIKRVLAQAVTAKAKK